jgi:phospholipid/cholesterol/gamma-HCH transport system ATP-binding protein
MEAQKESNQEISEETQKNESSNCVLEIKHLKKSFGDKEVLSEINLKLTKGENLVILGKSGSGKSVLIKCIVRLIEIDSGEIHVLENDISTLKNRNLNELRKKIGFLFQSGALYDSMTVRENLLFPLRSNLKLKNKDKEALVEEALNNVGLIETMNVMPSELSGGMRKRIGLARTLILKPEIMLYDEPTTGLDTITSMEISKLIMEIQKKYNTTSIIITHDLACAKITADRIIILIDGLCAAEGTYQELEQSKDPKIKSFFE